MLSLDSMYTDSMLSQIFRYVFKAIMEALRRLALGTVEEQQMVRTGVLEWCCWCILLLGFVRVDQCVTMALGTHRTHFFHFFLFLF